MARVYGRVTNEAGQTFWVQVNTDTNGFSDELNVTWLAQVLKLSLGESPFYADWGIPAHQSVITQVYPTYYVTLTQQRFASLFASIIISKVSGVAAPNKFTAPPPTYNVAIVSHTGAKFPPVAIPTQIPT
jgi:hypothetical protein